jgi:hypothetical protein
VGSLRFSEKRNIRLIVFLNRVCVVLRNREADFYRYQADIFVKIETVWFSEIGRPTFINIRLILFSNKEALCFVEV